MPKRKRPLLKSSDVEDKSGDGEFSSKPTKKTESNQDVGKKKRKSTAKQRGTWLVTCENKEGVMDLKKLERGESCIECEGLWLTPPAFEELAGKGSSKKWKSTIFHQGRPLGHWFSEGILSTAGYLRRGSEPMRKVDVPSKKDKRMSTSSVVKFQGTKSRKYNRSSSSVTQITRFSEKTVIKSAVDPDMSAAKGSDRLDCGHSVHLDAEDKEQDEDPNQSKTFEEDVLSAAESTKDHGTTEERHYDLDNTNAKKQELKVKSKVIIKRLSAKRRCKTREQPKDCWYEPLEKSTDSEEPKHTTETVGKENGKELNGNDDDYEKVTATSEDEDKTELSVAPQNLKLQCVFNSDTDEAKSDHGETELGRSGTCIQLSNGFHASEMLANTSGVSGRSDMDSLDLDQLKREKIKMQLKVLRLQEEYYTLMLKDSKARDLNCSNEN